MTAQTFDGMKAAWTCTTLAAAIVAAIAVVIVWAYT
jgi:hypothetical protein